MALLQLAHNKVTSYLGWNLANPIRTKHPATDCCRGDSLLLHCYRRDSSLKRPIPRGVHRALRSAAPFFVRVLVFEIGATRCSASVGPSPPPCSYYWPRVQAEPEQSASPSPPHCVASPTLSSSRPLRAFATLQQRYQQI